MATMFSGAAHEDDYRPALSEPADKEEIAEVSDNLHAWYEAGIPFFTKERLRILHEQLQDLGGGTGTITIPDLVGENTAFKIKTGQVIEETEEAESIAMRPHVRYMAIHKILNVNIYDPRDAYQNMPMAHITGPWRDKYTKEPHETEQWTPRSQSETMAYLETNKSDWDQSTQCQELTELLKSKPHLVVNKVVAFANASMASTSPGCHGENRSLRSTYQHALMLTLKDVFGAEHCYAQDPAYLNADKVVLADHGVQTVDDPQGFLEADDNTAVISISPDIPVKQVLCDVAKPAILIWTKVEDSGNTMLTDPNSTRLVKLMGEEYDCHDFPEGLEEYFGRIVIYIKKIKQAVAEDDE